MFLRFDTRRDAPMLFLSAAIWLLSVFVPYYAAMQAPSDSSVRYMFICGSMQNKWLAIEAPTNALSPDNQVMATDCPLCALLHLNASLDHGAVSVPTPSLLLIASSQDEQVSPPFKAVYLHDAPSRAPPSVV
jgi:hypothetical protein